MNNPDIFLVFKVQGDTGNNRSLITHLKSYLVKGKIMVLALYVCIENAHMFYNFAANIFK